MRIEQHPEYERYRQDEARLEMCRQVVEAWRARAEPIVGPDGSTWTVEQAEALVGELVRLFEAYNGVLWEQFSYCRQCGGGCCVAGASQITLFDGLAMALLDQSFPSRPEQLQITVRDCVYRTPQGCSWPADWRPLKCASFYCLGSGEWQLDAADERYQAITEALEQVVAQHVPDWLEQAGTSMDEPLRSTLADPIGFAQALNQALDAALVAPLTAHFPVLQQVAVAQGAWRSGQEGSGAGRIADEISAFIAQAAETVWTLLEAEEAAGALSAEQFLADLEELEWILLNQPYNQVLLITALLRRYDEPVADGDDDMTALWREMHGYLTRLLNVRQHEARWRSGRNLIRIEDIGPPVV